jgi:fibronectin type 3 domain-containing protein
MRKKLRSAYAACAAFGRIGRGTVVLVLALTGVLFVPGEAIAAPCQSSAPPSGAYSVNVCFTSPSDGSTATGPVSVSATVSVTGTSPGVRRMTYFLGGTYLLTDYQTPYTFTIPSDRFVDGVKTLEVEAWMRDGFISQRASIDLTFANGVTTPPVNTNTFTPTSGTTPPSGQPFVLAAAGDGAGGEQSETDTTNLIGSWNPNLFLYLGDVYEKGTVTEFHNWYRPTDTFYGRFHSITDPTIGNHEYTAGVAEGYFDYWDNVPHYYSFNAGGWHFISLDTNSAFNQTAPGTPQYNWLVSDLNANTNPCVIAYHHQPLYNIGDEGSTTTLTQFWSLFAQHGVDLDIVGHDHSYQRWLAMDGSGNPDPNGVTEIVVGTGGHALGAFITSDGRLAASAQQFGAVRLELNSGGASYQFITAQGQTLDSGSVGCNGSASDTTPPSAPTALTATGSYKTRIDLSWGTSTDNVGVTGYQIERDGQTLATIGAQTAYADTTVLPGTTHSYRVRALDAANNFSDFSNTASATTPTVAVLFYDGFESADFSKWTQNNGLAIQQSQVFAGAYAAEGVSTGSAGASAYKQLAQSETNLFYVTRFKVVSQATNVNVLRFRNNLAGANPLATLFVTTTNKVGLRNDVTALATTSTTVAAPNIWHTAEVHLHVNGSSSQSEVWLDGTIVPELSQSGINLGTNPIGRLELGDPSLSKTFDVTFDEVAYDLEFIGDVTAPTAATNLTGSPHSGLQVDLSWTAATDDVGISGYDVYRNGSLITSIPAGTSYSDKTVSPLTSYSYALVAKDAAGNVSPSSNTASVTTGDIFSDSFELGSLANWTNVNGLAAQQQVVDTGSWAARGTSTGAAGASAVQQLDATVNELYYRVRVKLLSQGPNSVSLLRFRTAANGALASAFISSTGKLGYRNDTSSTSTTSLQTVTPNIWHEVQMHVLVAGAASQVDLWLDGIKVVGQMDGLGTSPIGKIELGDPGLNRTFDVAFDNVVVDPMFVVDTAAPSAPSNLQSTNVTPSEVDLSWDAANDDVGVTTYRVKRNGAAIVDVDSATLTYADTGLQGGTQYTYTVTALDAVGHESPASNALQVTTTLPKPDRPTGLTAVPASGQNRVDLSWAQPANPAGVTGYRIYRNSSPTPIGTVDGVATTSYADSTVAPVTQYSYVVTAVDGGGHESDPSDPAVVTTSDTVAPTAPSGLSATAGTNPARVNLSWTAATDNVGVTGYRIFRSDSATPIGTVDGATTSYADSSVASGQTYTYTVNALDAAGNPSGPSNSATVTMPDSTPPTAPSSLTATPVSDIRVDLSWTAATDAVGVTGYRIYRNGSATPVATVNGSTTTFSDTGLTADTIYTYTVKAVDAAQNVSAASNTASATTYLFGDGFETGNLSRWTGSTNFAVSNVEHYTGLWAGLATSTGKKGVASYAYRQLSAPRTDLYYQVRFKLLSGKKDTVNLLRFKTAAGGSIVSLLYDSKFRLGYQVSAEKRLSSTTVATGVWYEAKVHVVVNGAASQVEVWLNGTKITQLSLTESLGTVPVSRIEVGESVAGPSYQLAFDDVLIKKTP